MRFRPTALAALFLLAPLTACGGGGGGANADDLCERSTENAIDNLLNGSGDIPEDFDEEREAVAVVVAADDGVEEEGERVNEFLDQVDEALDGVDRDDEEEVFEALEDEFDEDDFEDINDDLVALAEVVDDECDTEIVATFEGEAGSDADEDEDSGDEDSGDDEETTTTTEADDEETTTTAGDDSSGEDTSLEDFADLVESCEDGNMADCDELFFQTPIGSEAEDVGRTCGGVGDQTTSGRCEELFG